jgi:hypothetical protein
VIQFGVSVLLAAAVTCGVFLLGAALVLPADVIERKFLTPSTAERDDTDAPPDETAAAFDANPIVRRDGDIPEITMTARRLRGRPGQDRERAR